MGRKAAAHSTLITLAIPTCGLVLSTGTSFSSASGASRRAKSSRWTTRSNGRGKKCRATAAPRTAGAPSIANRDRGHDFRSGEAGFTDEIECGRDARRIEKGAGGADAED